jgi:hypothetical protein
VQHVGGCANGHTMPTQTVTVHLRHATRRDRYARAANGHAVCDVNPAARVDVGL